MSNKQMRAIKENTSKVRKSDKSHTSLIKRWKDIKNKDQHIYQMSSQVEKT